MIASPANTSGKNAFAWADVLAVALILIAVIAAEGRIVRFEFTSWDDDRTVAHNPKLNPPTMDSLVQIWSEPAMQLYVPLAHSVWWGLAWIGGGDETSTRNPHIYHAANLVVHAFTSIAVFAFLRRLKANASAAAAGALLFALHPVQIEAVAWVSGMKDLLAGLFSICSLLFYMRSAEFDPRPAGKNYPLAALFAALAMLSKPSAVVLPLMAAAIDWLVIGRCWRRIAASAGPLLLLSIPMAVIGRMVQASATMMERLPLWQRPLIALNSLAFYLMKVFWPTGLTIDYGRTPTVGMQMVGLRDGGIVLAGALLLWAICRSMPTMGKTVLAGAAIFHLGILPVLGLVGFGFQEVSTVADHYLYLPMLGMAIAFASVVGRGGKPALAVAGCVLFAMGAMAHRQSGYWRDSNTLFTRAIEINPRSFSARNNLAVEALNHERPRDAEPLARAALAIRPAYPEALVNLATALDREGNVADAIVAMSKAIELRPKNAAYQAGLGGMLLEARRPRDAEAAARAALRLEPDQGAAYVTLGEALVLQNRLVEAADALTKAAGLLPNSAQTAVLLAAAQAENGQTAKAAEECRRALRIEPGFAPARQLLSRLVKN